MRLEQHERYEPLTLRWYGDKIRYWREVRKDAELNNLPEDRDKAIQMLAFWRDKLVEAVHGRS